MRALLGIVLVAAALWAGYWFAGSTAVKRGAEAAFAQAAAQGLEARNSGVRVSGFPNRFDLTVTAPEVLDRATGWGWRGGDVQLLAMTWKPWHLIALLPQDQVLSTPFGDVALTADRLRASVVLHPGTDLALWRTVVEAEAVAADGAPGRLSFARATLATTEDTSRRNSHRIGVQVDDLVPDPAVQAALPDLPGTIAGLRLDATALFSAPIDRHAGAVQLTGLVIDDASVDWGPLQAVAKGSLAVASDGRAEGRIDLRVESWGRVPAVLGAIGAIDPAVAPTLLRALELLAAEGTDPAVLEVPLTFKSGRMSLGALPLGAAPVLAQRQ